MFNCWLVGESGEQVRHFAEGCLYRLEYLPRFIRPRKSLRGCRQ